MGAGASHGCVVSTGSPHGILMRDLGEPLSAKLQSLVSDEFSGDLNLINLVNSVIDETTDFEHVITFLDDAPSLRHRQFADEMRKAFEEVLRDKLRLIRDETRGDPTFLYKVLLDMHNLDALQEELHGLITTNYDEYIEDAIEAISESPADFGIRVEPAPQQGGDIRLLKLHGSFGWRATWPISRNQGTDATVWIPPGIQKVKSTYPFNVLWGLAREMLYCDILRVIGCRLGGNDWDLISLLFSMRHSSSADQPRIEVIDSPQYVNQLKDSYPYLELISMLEIEPLGSRLINEITGLPGYPFDEFSQDEQEQILTSTGANRNWFELWLTQKIEIASYELPTISTNKGIVEDFLGT